MKVTIFDNYHAGVSSLPDSEQDAFYGAIMRYAFDGIEPALEGTAAAIWATIRALVDKSIKGQSDGSKGGDGRGNRKTENPSRKPPAKTPAENPKEKPSDKTPAENPPVKPTQKRGTENQKKGIEGNGIENLEDFYSNSQAPDGAAAAGAAPPVAVGCPTCGLPMQRTDSRSGRKRIYRCNLCGEEKAVEEVA